MTTESQTPCYDSAPGSVKQAVAGMANDIASAIQEALNISTKDCEPNMPALREALAVFVHDCGTRSRIRHIIDATALAKKAIAQAQGRTH